MPLMPRSLLLSASLCVLATATPALAQKTVEGRVDKLEKEMQAVQRKVFPGGAGQIVAPDVTPETPPVQQVGSPASSPLADLTSRVSAIETQVARLTGQVEESDHRLRLLEDANTKLAAQVQTLQAQAAAAAAAAQAAADPTPPAQQPFVAPSGPPPKPAAAGPVKAAPPAVTKPSAAASQARTDAVAAIEKPSSGNGALDGYTYGYRLWMAKFYPEAEAQLEDILGKYPNDPMASRTGNLLGRAYLDDGKPTQAAKVLFANYRDRPKGDRAAESLAWVAEALIQLDHPKDACKAYDEIRDSFGDAVPANVKDMVAKGRVTAKCGA